MSLPIIYLIYRIHMLLIKLPREILHKIWKDHLKVYCEEVEHFNKLLDEFLNDEYTSANISEDRLVCDTDFENRTHALFTWVPTCLTLDDYTRILSQREFCSCDVMYINSQLDRYLDDILNIPIYEREATHSLDTLRKMEAELQRGLMVDIEQFAFQQINLEIDREILSEKKLLLKNIHVIRSLKSELRRKRECSCDRPKVKAVMYHSSHVDGRK